MDDDGAVLGEHDRIVPSHSERTGMENHQHPSPVLLPHDQPAGVVACSICLRVKRETEWIEPEDAIRELRSFELQAPLHLAPGLCDGCSHDIAERRGRAFAAAA